MKIVFVYGHGLLKPDVKFDDMLISYHYMQTTTSLSTDFMKIVEFRRRKNRKRKLK